MMMVQVVQLHVILCVERSRFLTRTVVMGLLMHEKNVMMGIDQKQIDVTINVKIRIVETK